MGVKKDRKNLRRMTTIHQTSVSSSRRSSKRFPEPLQSGSLQGVRGKMSSNCLWHACQALFLGLLLFSAGASMSVLGFYSDGLFDPDTRKNRSLALERISYLEDHHIHPMKFSRWSYAGPIVMGFGGFIIVATCVLTFEARDNASKVGPAKLIALRSTESSGTPVVTTPVNPSKEEFNIREKALTTAILDVRSVASQTILDTNSQSNSLTNLNLFDKRLQLIEKFRRFSKTMNKSEARQPSISISYDFDGEIHRCPSAPNLNLYNERNKTESKLDDHFSGSYLLSRVPQRRGSQVPKALLRQTMSVDYTSSCGNSSEIRKFQKTSKNSSSNKNKSKNKTVKSALRRGSSSAIPAYSTSTTNTYNNSKKRSDSLELPLKPISSSTGQVDVYFPNGTVTLNILNKSSSPNKKLSFFDGQPAPASTITSTSGEMEIINFPKSPNFGVKNRHLHELLTTQSVSSALCKPTISRPLRRQSRVESSSRESSLDQIEISMPDIRAICNSSEFINVIPEEESEIQEV